MSTISLKSEIEKETTFNIGVIGAGYRTQKLLSQICCQKNEVSISFICDPLENNLFECQNLAENIFGVRPEKYLHYEEVADELQSACGIIYVATPHAISLEIATFFLNRGLSVIAEKPLAVNLADVDVLKQSRTDKGGLIVAYQAYLNPKVREIRNRARNREFGELHAVYAYCHQDWISGHQNSWRTGGHGSGFTADTGAHLINLISMFAGPVSTKRCNVAKSFHGADVVSSFTGECTHNAAPVVAYFDATVKTAKRAVATFHYEDAILEVDAWGRSYSITTPRGHLLEFSNNMEEFNFLRDVTSFQNFLTEFNDQYELLELNAKIIDSLQADGTFE